MVVPTAILHENRALPPPMITAMADTATGLQIAGLRTTKARIGSVPAKDAFIWGQSTPVKQTGMLTHAEGNLNLSRKGKNNNETL